jgi:hypothetical protein
MDAKEFVEQTLEHHGIKGMRWGVRSKQERAARKIEKSDARLERNLRDPHQQVSLRVDLHNSVHDVMNQHIGRINAKPEYEIAAEKGQLLDENHPISKKYTKEYMDAYMTELNKSAAKLGTNASGTRRLAVKEDPSFLGFKVVSQEIKHADTLSFRVNFVRDEKGRIIDLVLDSLEQGATLVAETFLTHHGVKGQRWGVRRLRNSIAAKNAAARQPQPVKVELDKRAPKVGIKTSGGKFQPAHADAIGAAVTRKQLKESGLNSLSNKDLQELATRLDLEQRVTRLDSNKGPESAGKKFVKFMINDKGNQKIAQDQSAKLVGSMIAKRAAARA